MAMDDISKNFHLILVSKQDNGESYAKVKLPADHGFDFTGSMAQTVSWTSSLHPVEVDHLRSLLRHKSCRSTGWLSIHIEVY